MRAALIGAFWGVGQERQEMLGSLGYCARQIDVRAIKKFRLEAIEPGFKESANVPSPDGAA
jgi:hypothetical protein